jgi:hypothetical protein
MSLPRMVRAGVVAEQEADELHAFSLVVVS